MAARALGVTLAPAEPTESASEAGLQYVHDDRPGIRRKRAGTGFHYFGPDGTRITDRRVLLRIRQLVVPPAWIDVWVCPNPRGHLQATGRDTRGRKVYLYHSRWREVRDAAKYDRLAAFGEALPSIRKRVDLDLRRHGVPREKALAAAVKLLEETVATPVTAAAAPPGKPFVAFGPADHAKQAGPPQTSTTSFRVLNPATAYILLVSNGGLQSQHDRVSAGTITLNGTSVVVPSDFTQTVATIEKPSRRSSRPLRCGQGCQLPWNRVCTASRRKIQLWSTGAYVVWIAVRLNRRLLHNRVTRLWPGRGFP
jgi:hypothetical protein